MKFIDFHNLFKSKVGISKLADIARALNVSPQTINNWKRNDSIPHKIRLEIKKKYFSINDKTENKIINPVEDNNVKNKFTSHKIETSISIHEIIFKIQSNYKVFFLIPAIALIFILFYIFFIAKPIYSSTASIIPANSESSVNSMVGMAAQLGISMPAGSSGQRLVYPEIIKGRTLAKKILLKKFYSDILSENKTLLEILFHEDGLKLGIDTLLIFGMKKFKNSLTVNENIKTGIVSLQFDASEPKLASNVLKSLIAELDLHQKAFNTEQIKKKRIFIEERIKDVRFDLTTSEEKIKNFRIKNKKYSDSPSLLLEFERLMMESEVLKQLYITLKQEYEMTQIKEIEESDILYTLDEPNTPLGPSSPKKKFLIILTLLISFFISLLFILIKQQ